MNKNIIKSLLSVAAIALMGWGCETNHFNESYLPDYEGEGQITDVHSIELTLDGDHYAAIAKLGENKDIAQEAGEEAVAALNALGKNQYFNTPDDAAAYLPAYLSSLYPTYDNGSIAMVTYTTALDIPADVVAMNAAAEYTLSEEDYKTIWGEEESHSALTPSTVNKLKSVLKPAEGMKSGDYMVVTYNYASEEFPKEEPETPDTPVEGYTAVLGKAALNDAVEVRGYISAISTQGPILTDDGGSILLYKTNGYQIGDEVTVSGTISAYNCGFQIGTDGISIEKTGTTTVTYPTPVELTGAAMDELLTTRTENDYAQFVKIVGTVSISGNYYNFDVDGANTAVGSFYGLTEDQKAILKDGEKTTIYGYFVSISKSSGAPKYVNFITTHINEIPEINVDNNYTTVLGKAALNDAVEVKGYISAISAQGPILTDNGGSILLYKTTGYQIGDEVTVSGTISAYNKGFQIGTTGISIEKTGTTTVTYPTPLDITGAVADDLLISRTDNDYAIYAKMTGVTAVDKYINFDINGATSSQGSVYGATDELKAALTDGMACTLYGYFVSISSGKYINMIVTSVEPAAATTSATRASVAVDKLYAYFKYNGSAFEATNIVAIQPADYAAMGQTYGSFTNPKQDNYLPLFLAESYPYAMEGDEFFVGYRCYASGTTSWKVDHYTFGTDWNKVVYFENKTDQFRKSEGKWNVDRTLELDYTGNGADTKAFYQYCVNWVYDNKDVALGAPARDNAGQIISTEIVTINGEKPAGNFWVSNYGNNEFYTGASAYYGNMDWRASACKGGFAAAGMGDLTDEQIVEKLKEHTAEVFAAVLGYVYPTMSPEEYKKVVIKVYAYGPNQNYAYSFAVTGVGTFEYIADSMTEI